MGIVQVAPAAVRRRVFFGDFLMGYWSTQGLNYYVSSKFLWKRRGAMFKSPDMLQSLFNKVSMLKGKKRVVPCRIGVVGLGVRMGGVLKELLQASDGKVEIVAVCDPRRSSAEAILKDLGIFGVSFFDSPEQLFADRQVDWVFIGSYNSLHSKHAIAAMEAGKDVFVEKPLATTLQDAFAVKAAIARTGRTFSLGLVLRYSDHYRRMKALIDEGVIGKVVSFEFSETLDFNHGGHIFSNWRRFKEMSGGHILEKCCHDLDIANWLIGRKAVRCASFGGKGFFLPENRGRVEQVGKNGDGRDAYYIWNGDHPYDAFGEDSTVVDHQVAIIEYEGGIRASFHTNSNTAMPQRRFYICGTEGTLDADVLRGTITVRRIGFDKEPEVYHSAFSGGHGGGEPTMIASLLETFFDGAPPLAGIDEGMESGIVAFALNEAMEQGCIVDINALRREGQAMLSGTEQKASVVSAD